MDKILHFLNSNHWYVIGFFLVAGFLIWIHGCQSTCKSMIHPEERVTREGLQAEVDYLMAQAKVKLSDLDQQDEIKRLLLEQAAMFTTTGTFNPMGLLNTIISIGAISFGLDRNKKLKEARRIYTTGSISSEEPP